MLNALVQVLTLVYGLSINFLTPAVYGLAGYGEFIALNALVFLVHRSLTIICEPLIRFTDAKSLIYSALMLNGGVFVLFTLITAIHPIGSPLLLFGMLLSSAVLLSLQALRLRRAYSAFLCVATGLFLALLLYTYVTDLSLPLVRAMEVSATIPALIWLVFVLRNSDNHPRGQELLATVKNLLRQVPQLLTMTAVMNLFMSALPVFFARTLVPYDLGLFRVMTSVIQSSTSLFPISTQALLATFVQHAKGRELFALVEELATLYFAAIAAVLMLLGLVVPAAVPYVALAACLPVYYRAILLERHLTARHRTSLLMGINLLVAVPALAVVPSINTVEGATMLYATGFTAYAVVMAAMRRGFVQQLPTLIVMLACPLAVMLTRGDMRFGLFYIALVVLVELMRRRPTKAAVLRLWREM